MTTDHERQTRLGQRYQALQQANHQLPASPAPPQRLPADQRTRWGGKKESAELAQHHREMDQAYFAARRAAYVAQWQGVLEPGAVRLALAAIAAEEQELMQYDPGSLPGILGEQMVLDSAERIRTGTTDIMQSFRRRALGTG